MSREHEIQVVSAIVRVGEQEYKVTPGLDGVLRFDPPMWSHEAYVMMMEALSNVCTWQGHRWEDVTQVSDEHKTSLCIVCGATKETF